MEECTIFNCSKIEICLVSHEYLETLSRHMLPFQYSAFSNRMIILSDVDILFSTKLDKNS